MASLDEVLKRRERAMGQIRKEEPTPPGSIATTCPHCKKDIAVVLVAVGNFKQEVKAENSSNKHPLLGKIEQMLLSGLYGWSEDFLGDVAEKVRQYGKPTPKQEQAVKNIYNKAAEKFEDEYGEELF